MRIRLPVGLSAAAIRKAICQLSALQRLDKWLALPRHVASEGRTLPGCVLCLTLPSSARHLFEAEATARVTSCSLFRVLYLEWSNDYIRTPYSGGPWRLLLKLPIMAILSSHGTV
eukprot:4515746-Prymnesium_polylepis.1